MSNAVQPQNIFLLLGVWGILYDFFSLSRLDLSNGVSNGLTGLVYQADGHCPTPPLDLFTRQTGLVQYPHWICPMLRLALVTPSH
jgi:hypothetical protein